MKEKLMELITEKRVALKKLARELDLLFMAYHSISDPYDENGKKLFESIYGYENHVDDFYVENKRG